MYFKTCFVISLIFAASISCGYAQQDSLLTDDNQSSWQPGYVVLNNNDTLYGTIKKRQILRLDKIDFKENGSNKRKPYYVNDLKSFRWKDQLYMPLFIKSLSQYSLYGLAGGMNCFTYVAVNGFARLYIAEGNFVSNTFTQWHVKKKGVDGIILKRGFFNDKKRNELADYFGDDLKLSEEIRQGKYTVDSLENVVIYYNNWVNAQNKEK